MASRIGGEPSFSAGETIILKDCSGNLVDYGVTRQTERLHRSLEPLNSCLKGLQIELPGAVRQGQHLHAGNSVILTVPGNGLRRVFNRGSFLWNGRAYAWWQNIPKSVRGNLLIDGEMTAEADFSALHATILYSERGIKLSGDPYDLDGFPRPLVKMAFNIAINANGRYAAVCSIAENAEITRAAAAKLLHAIDHRHKPINDAFCSDDGVRLMRIDSELILLALKLSNDGGFGALPIHDSLIAPARLIDLAEANMVQAFEKIVCRVNPCPIRIKRGKVLQMGEVLVLPPSDLRQAA